MILGASKANLSAIRAMANDVKIIAIDKNPGELIDEPYLKVVRFDFSNKFEVLAFAKDHQIDGVYPMNDHAIQVAAYLAAELCLKGLLNPIAKNFIDKSRMRTIWRESELNQPRFRLVTNKDEAVNAASDIGFPVIIKPASSGGGGRGVTRVDEIGSIGSAIDEAERANQYSKILIVEKYMDGIESSIEMVFIEKVATVIAISSKVKADSVKQVAVEISYPAQFDGETLEQISVLCQEAGVALGISTGVTHFEVITNCNGIPALVEVGGRVGGGHTFHPIASHVSGIDYPRLVANLYVGNIDVCLKILEAGILSRGAVYAFPTTLEHGIIREIAFESINVNDSVVHTEVWKSPGDAVVGLNDSLDRLGCVVSLAQTHSLALLTSRSAMSKFAIKIENTTFD